MFYLQAPERFARRDNFDTVPCGPSSHVSNVVSDDPLAPGGYCCLQHKFRTGYDFMQVASYSSTKPAVRPMMKRPEPT